MSEPGQEKRRGSEELLLFSVTEGRIVKVREDFPCPDTARELQPIGQSARTTVSRAECEDYSQPSGARGLPLSGQSARNTASVGQSARNTASRAEREDYSQPCRARGSENISPYDDVWCCTVCMVECGLV